MLHLRNRSQNIGKIDDSSCAENFPLLHTFPQSHSESQTVQLCGRKVLRFHILETVLLRVEEFKVYFSILDHHNNILHYFTTLVILSRHERMRSFHNFSLLFTIQQRFVLIQCQNNREILKILLHFRDTLVSSKKLLISKSYSCVVVVWEICAFSFPPFGRNF